MRFFLIDNKYFKNLNFITLLIYVTYFRNNANTFFLTLQIAGKVSNNNVLVILSYEKNLIPTTGIS